MKDLLNEFIKCSDDYVAAYKVSTTQDLDIVGEKLNDAGDALREALKNKGLSLDRYEYLLEKFISSNVHRTTENKDVALSFEQRNVENIQNLKNFLGVL